MRFLLLLVPLALTACSRGGHSSGFSLVFPGSDQSSFANEDTLKKTITVVQIGGREPARQEINYAPGEIPRGQDLNVLFNNVQLGTSYFIQFLAVFDNSLTGGTKVSYGYAQGTVQRQTDINITAQNISLSDTMIRVAGRYMSGFNAGPTGKIIASFIPALNHPPIEFDSFEMINGWFEAMAPDADPFLGAVRLSFNGGVLFDNLASTNPQLNAYGPRLLRVKKPLSYHAADSTVVPTPEADLYLGFWGQASSETMCYINAPEDVSFEFRDGNLMSPLEYRGDSGTASQVRVVEGGVAHTYATFPGSGCSLRFDHQHVSSPLPLHPLIVQ